MAFAPIAIVGRSCVLPGVLTPAQLWDAVVTQNDLTTDATLSELRLTPQAASWLKKMVPHWRGGWIRGFAEVFDARRFLAPEEEILPLDPLFHWVLHAAFESMQDAGLELNRAGRSKLFLANLGYPTRDYVQFAENVWFGKDLPLAQPLPVSKNRFSSGYPAFLAAKALGLSDAVAFDAACASSLYAIALAAAELAAGRIDIALAGGVNAIDPLIYHTGFGVLQALSRSGQSMPFDEKADGLLPCQGAAFVVLKRLSDAIAHGDTIHGLIRGVGLSNDGRAGGMLFPAKAGQLQALANAYRHADIDPNTVSLLECHATGTPVGDPVEIESCATFYKNAPTIGIGSLKANLGHAITVAGMAGLLKVLEAFKHQTLPPNRPVAHPIKALQNTPFHLLQKPEPWESVTPRRAGVNAFGFGGNNAHLIVEEWTGVAPDRVMFTPPVPKKEAIAIVAMEVAAGGIPATEGFTRGLYLQEGQKEMAPFVLPLEELRIPPKDLQAALAQQVLLLELARRVAKKTRFDPAKTSILVGMEVDAEACRVPALPRVLGLLAKRGIVLDDAFIAKIQKEFSFSFDPAFALGTMPNILANRINGFLDIKGPSYVVEAEELSGIEALSIGIEALQAKEIDTALVGAIDLCSEPVHDKAAKETLGAARQPAGDAGVIFVLKRLSDARAQDDTILAVIEAHDEKGLSFGLSETSVNLTPTFGHAHAASGLLHCAAAVMALNQRLQPAQNGKPALPWLSAQKRHAHVKMDSAFGQSRTVSLKEGEGLPAFTHPFMMPNVFLFAGESEHEVKEALLAHRSGGSGPVRLAIVARNEEEYQLRHRLAANAFAKEAVPSRIARGVYYAKAPIAGDLAFVFPGAAAAYPGMGREFLLAFPEIGDKLLERFPKLEQLLPWLDPLREDLLQDPQMVLFGSTFFCQVHAAWSKNVLGLRPQAVLGVSSGETNAVMAMEAWEDLDRMLEEIMQSGMYTKEIAGEYGVVRRSWQIPESAPVDWQSIRVLATPEEVQSAIGNDPKVFLTMINAPKDCIVSGDGASVLRVAKIFGPQKATPLGHDIVAHCPLMKAWEKEWRAIHCRKTRPVPGVRFYSNASGTCYTADQEAIADALTNQATGPVDFRRVVEAAYQDGVRIFLEHGPRSSTTHWIEEILGDRHHLAVSLDRPRGSTDHPMESLAQLWTVGVDIPFERLPKTQWAKEETKRRLLTFAAHPKPIVLPSLQELSNKATTDSEKTETTNMLTPTKETTDSPQDTMIAAPKFASVFQQWQAASGQQPLAQPQIAKEQVRTTQVKPQPVQTINPSTRLAVARQIQQFHADVALAHQHFLGQQERALNLVSRLLQSSPTPAHASSPSELPPPMPSASPAPSMPSAAATVSKPPQQFSEAASPPRSQPTLQNMPAPKSATPRQESKAGAPLATVKPKATPKAQPQKIEADVSRRIKDVSFEEAFPQPLPGPKWSREDLEYMSYGKLSKVFGPEFAGQDQYARQVRMPMPPLLLAEEVLGIDGEPKSMASKATMWTASRIPDYLWCLHHGRLPAFLGLEVGQADLLLISWLGVDFENKDQRMYRLLGCDVVFNGDDLARPGQRIMCDIHVEGYAKAGPVRVFFFNANAWVNKKRQVTTLSAQAGFFTEEELKSSGGVIWDPEEVTLPAEACLEPPLIAVTKTSFNRQQIQAFTEGRPWECFGDALRPAQVQQRTPTIARGPMCLFDEVTDLDVQGGPWKRGYIRAVKRFTMEEWFYDGHFYNDPCMPGTLMCEGAFEVLSFYLAALGLTLNRDGFHFVPVPGKVYPLRARGQVVPGSKEMIYEIFIRELHYNNAYGFPYVEASLLCTVDGRKAFLCETGAWALVPGHPLDSRSRILGHDSTPEKAAALAGVRYDRDALLTLAWGKLSERFGERYANFDGGKAAARLAGPPYLFLSRIVHIGDGEMTAEYDLTPDCWLFSEQETDALGASILLEMGKQASLTFAHMTGLPLALGTEVKARLLQAALSTLRTIGREDDVKTLTIAVKETAKQHLADHIELQTNITITAEGKTIAQGNITLGLYGAQLPRQALARTEASQMPASQTYQTYEHTPRMLAPFSTLSVREENDAVVLQLPLEASWIFACNTLQDPHLPASFFVATVENALAFWLKQSYQAIATHTLEALHRHDDACFGQNLVATIRLTINGQNIQAASRLIADDAVVMESASTFTKASATSPGDDIVLDIAQKTWVLDCRHGAFGPALPMALVLDWLAKAALDRLPGRVALDMTDVTLSTMLPLDQPLRLRLQGMPVDGYRVESMLQYWDAEDKQFKLLAKSLVLLGEEYMIAGKGEKALGNATVIDNPYEAAMLFQGPAFAAVQHLSLGKEGIDALLNPDPLPFADTTLNVKLLDAALALVAAKLPREDFMTMLPENAFFVPWTVKKAIFRGPTPTDGRVHARVRFDAWEKEGESFWLDIQILTTKPWERLLSEVGIWAKMQVLYRIVQNPWPEANNREKIKAFLAERHFVPNLGLSQQKSTHETVLESAKIAALQAIPGLMAVLYGQAAEAAEHIAVKEHIAPKALGHPAFSSILQKDKKGWLATSAATPLARYPIAVTTTAKSIKVADTAPFYLDMEAGVHSWSEKLGLANWLGADLFYALAKKFYHQLYASQPSFYPMLANRGVVYFANHQLDMEGVLFSLFTVAFLGKPTFIMARKEVVEETWLVDILLLLGERLGVGEENGYLGFVLVERSDPREILEEFKEHIQAVKDHGLSLLIHVEGEHAKRAGQQVEKLSASLVDMVTEIGVPIVPLRFAGALPKTPVARLLDYPVGFGQQDVYMGMPILPEQLKPFPSKIRKEKVLAALNALGPQPFESEEPLPPDALFAQNIEEAKARFAFSEKAALLYVLLKGLDAPSEETRALLAALESRKTDQLTDPWLQKFALSIFKAK
jgi:acyl transferase domain-containing protein/3-hydroxymyristoyl/3-hydroxydecanoyl-(acyl carrier protein) dehydratase/1-acyl-sn-glycerol-3-phosphate acyltransferase